MKNTKKILAGFVTFLMVVSATASSLSYAGGVPANQDLLKPSIKSEPVPPEVLLKTYATPEKALAAALGTTEEKIDIFSTVRGSIQTYRGKAYTLYAYSFGVRSNDGLSFFKQQMAKCADGSWTTQQPNNPKTNFPAKTQLTDNSTFRETIAEMSNRGFNDVQLKGSPIYIKDGSVVGKEEKYKVSYTLPETKDSMTVTVLRRRTTKQPWQYQILKLPTQNAVLTEQERKLLNGLTLLKLNQVTTEGSQIVLKLQSFSAPGKVNVTFSNRPACLFATPKCLIVEPPPVHFTIEVSSINTLAVPVIDLDKIQEGQTISVGFNSGLTILMKKPNQTILAISEDKPSTTTTSYKTVEEALAAFEAKRNSTENEAKDIVIYQKDEHVLCVDGINFGWCGQMVFYSVMDKKDNTRHYHTGFVNERPEDKTWQVIEQKQAFAQAKPEQAFKAEAFHALSKLSGYQGLKFADVTLHDLKLLPTLQPEGNELYSFSLNIAQCPAVGMGPCRLTRLLAQGNRSLKEGEWHYQITSLLSAPPEVSYKTMEEAIVASQPNVTIDKVAVYSKKEMPGSDNPWTQDRKIFQSLFSWKAKDSQDMHYVQGTFTQYSDGTWTLGEFGPADERSAFQAAGFEMLKASRPDLTFGQVKISDLVKLESSVDTQNYNLTYQIGDASMEAMGTRRGDVYVIFIRALPIIIPLPNAIINQIYAMTGQYVWPEQIIEVKTEFSICNVRTHEVINPQTCYGKITFGIKTVTDAGTTLKFYQGTVSRDTYTEPRGDSFKVFDLKSTGSREIFRASSSIFSTQEHPGSSISVEITADYAPVGPAPNYNPTRLVVIPLEGDTREPKIFEHVVKLGWGDAEPADPSLRYENRKAALLATGYKLVAEVWRTDHMGGTGYFVKV